jgi:AcrR family transcriptional regulator
VSPRPRKVSDEDVFAAAYRVMSRVGPAEFTLDAIAREVGVTPGALVQRFGSKQALLRAFSAGMAEATPDMLAQLRARHRSPTATLRAYAKCMAGLAETPAAFVRNLAYLQGDLNDPVIRAQLAAQARTTRAGFEALIREAITARELKPSTNPKALARTIEAVISGSLMTWVFYQETSAAKWMGDDVDAVLSPYRVRGKVR